MPGRCGIHGRKRHDGRRGLGLLSFRGRPSLDCEGLSSLSQTKPLSSMGFLAGLPQKACAPTRWSSSRAQKRIGSARFLSRRKPLGQIPPCNPSLKPKASRASSKFNQEITAQRASAPGSRYISPSASRAPVGDRNPSSFRRTPRTRKPKHLHHAPTQAIQLGSAPAPPR